MKLFGVLLLCWLFLMSLGGMKHLSEEPEVQFPELIMLSIGIVGIWWVWMKL